MWSPHLSDTKVRSSQGKKIGVWEESLEEKEGEVEGDLGLNEVGQTKIKEVRTYSHLCVGGRRI